MGDGSAESGPMNGPGKPGAGKPHARIDEGELETGHGLGTAAPAMKCVDSAGPIGHRASLLLCGGIGMVPRSVDGVWHLAPTARGVTHAGNTSDMSEHVRGVHIGPGRLGDQGDASFTWH